MQLVKSTKTRREARKKEFKAVFQSPVLLPDVGVRGEDSILQRFRGHPAHRQQTLPSFPVIICLVDISRHAKICKAQIL